VSGTTPASLSGSSDICSRQGKIERMLLERWSYIRKSKLDKKLSFVKIAKKLYEKYSIKVDQSYLYKIWKKVEGDL
jgi:hypothetical protein